MFKFVKDLFSHNIDELSKDFLEKKKLSISRDDYERYLKIMLGKIEVIILASQKKGITNNSELKLKLDLLREQLK